MKEQWWKTDKYEVGNALIEQVRFIEEKQRVIYSRYGEHLGLYMGRGQIDCKDAISYLGQIAEDRGIPLNFNICRSCVDTVTAQITVNPPRIQFLTDGGNWDQQTRAKGLQKYTDGYMAQEEVGEEVDSAFNDSAWGGTGFVHGYIDNGKVKIERIFPTEVIVDEQASATSKPRCMYHIKKVAIEKLAALYPEKRKQIEEATTSPSKSNKNIPSDNIVEVFHGWHLESGKRSKDGRFVCCIENVVLIDESWPYEWFPLVPVHWQKPVIGFVSQGLVEIIKPVQYEINTLLEKVQRGMELGSELHVVAKKNSLEPDMVSNKPGTIWEYNGDVPPAVMMPDAISQQVINQIWALEQKAYNLAGVSMLSAHSEKPSGNLSGAALRNLHDTETRRFGTQEKKWDKAHRDVVDLIVKLTKIAAESTDEDSSPAVFYRAKGYLEKIYWKQVDLPEDAYIIQNFPTSKLPKDPAGRMQMIQEWIGMGWIDPIEGARLLDFPDLDTSRNLRLSAFDDIQFTMDKMLFHGEYIAPDEMQDIELGLKWARMTYLWGRRHSAPHKNLDMLVNWQIEAKKVAMEQKKAIADEQMAIQAMTTPPQPPQMPVASMPEMIAQGGFGVPPQLQPGM